MQSSRGGEKAIRITLIVIVLILAFVSVLYLMKRSELATFREELRINKVKHDTNIIMYNC